MEKCPIKDSNTRGERKGTRNFVLKKVMVLVHLMIPGG